MCIRDSLYAKPGSYEVTLRIVDDDDGAHTRRLVVDVAANDPKQGSAAEKAEEPAKAASVETDDDQPAESPGRPADP